MDIYENDPLLIRGFFDGAINYGHGGTWPVPVTLLFAIIEPNKVASRSWTRCRINAPYYHIAFIQKIIRTPAQQALGLV